MVLEATPSRLEQLTASFRSLGCSNINMTYDFEAKAMRIIVGWSDGDGSIVVNMTGPDRVNLMVAAGMEMSRRLAAERPNLTFPPVIWT